MIRKLYTILLIGLCLNLVACGDDHETSTRMRPLLLSSFRWNNWTLT